MSVMIVMIFVVSIFEKEQTKTKYKSGTVPRIIDIEPENPPVWKRGQSSEPKTSILGLDPAVSFSGHLLAEGFITETTKN